MPALLRLAPERRTDWLRSYAKLYWTDVGLLRHLAGQHGPLTGALFEDLVVAH